MKKIILIILSLSIMFSYETIPYTEVFTLDNGMKVALSPNYETPLINIAFLVNHGKIDDPYGTHGYGVHIAKLLMGHPGLEPASIVNHEQYNNDFEALGIIFDPLKDNNKFNPSQSFLHTFFE